MATYTDVYQWLHDLDELNRPLREMLDRQCGESIARMEELAPRDTTPNPFAGRTITTGAIDVNKEDF